MELFRVTKQLYQHDLSGQGAFLNGGRWNSIGYAALYMASHRSLAILETVVHLRVPRPPEDYVITVIYAPDTIAIQNVSLNDLSKNWKKDTRETQQIGDKWLDANQSSILRVPSVIATRTADAAEYNYILNPKHPAFQELKIINTEPLMFDERFFRKV
jgi:RES domain-containing protein